MLYLKHDKEKLTKQALMCKAGEPSLSYIKTSIVNSVGVFCCFGVSFSMLPSPPSKGKMPERRYSGTSENKLPNPSRGESLIPLNIPGGGYYQSDRKTKRWSGQTRHTGLLVGISPYGYLYNLSFSSFVACLIVYAYGSGLS